MKSEGRGGFAGRVCLLLLALVGLLAGNGVAAAYPDVDGVDTEASAIVAAPTSEDAAPSEAGSSLSCLPFYSEPQFVLRVNYGGSHSGTYEPSPTAADFNGDGLDDIVITRLNFKTYDTFELGILLNDGNGSVMLATSSIFSAVPTVQNPRQVIIADFNGDRRSDIFVADHGYDADPFPGYQNALVLTAPGGKLVDATGNLPQQSTFTHSAAAADIDGDGDIDLYVGNTWGQTDLDPQILLNDGSGGFTLAENRLPPLVDLNQNGYTTCEFSDVDNDGSQDLILGDAGDDISNPHSRRDSVVLLNDGTGVFTLLPDAMPPKDFSDFDMCHDIQPINLNGDDYVDLFVVYERLNAQGSYIQALINNQDGTFGDETESRLESFDRRVWIHALELRDLDRDGDLDLLAWPWDDQHPDPMLFLDDGHGHFTLKAHDFGCPYLYDTFLDLDGDGGHDILFITFAPPEEVFLIRDLGCPMFLPLILRDRWMGN